MDTMFKLTDSSRSYIKNRLVLTELYETTYNIFDFTRPNTGLSSVAVHPKEEYYLDTILDNRLREYLELEVNKNTGVSFMEYMNLPRHHIENINRTVREYTHVKHRIQKKIEAEQMAEQEREEAKSKRENRNKRLDD